MKRQNLLNGLFSALTALVAVPAMATPTVVGTCEYIPGEAPLTIEIEVNELRWFREAKATLKLAGNVFRDSFVIKKRAGGLNPVSLRSAEVVQSPFGGSYVEVFEGATQVTELTLNRFTVEVDEQGYAKGDINWLEPMRCELNAEVVNEY